MNNQECNKILGQIKMIDKTIHQQELGIKFDDDNLLDSSSSDLKNLDSFKNATLRFSKKPNEVKKQNLTPIYNPKLDDNMIKTIFENIIDETGFVIEEKLLKILEPYHETDSKLIKLSNIFSVSLNPLFGI